MVAKIEAAKCGQLPEKRRLTTREYFRFSPLGNCPSRVAFLLILGTAECPPLLLLWRVSPSWPPRSTRTGRFSDEPFRLRDIQFDCPVILVEACALGEETRNFGGTRRFARPGRPPGVVSLER